MLPTVYLPTILNLAPDSFYVTWTKKPFSNKLIFAVSYVCVCLFKITLFPQWDQCACTCVCLLRKWYCNIWKHRNMALADNNSWFCCSKCVFFFFSRSQWKSSSLKTIALWEPFPCFPEVCEEIGVRGKSKSKVRCDIFFIVFYWSSVTLLARVAVVFYPR